MNDVVLRYEPCFVSVEHRTVKCDCIIHQGDIMEQVVAKSKSGKTLVVMEDMYGVHAAVGHFKSLDDAPCRLVTPKELEYMICEAIQ